MKVSTENDNNFGYEKITILVDNIPLKRIYDISNLISNTGGEESTDFDEDTPINTRLRFRVPQNMIFLIFSAGTRRYRSRVKVPGTGS
jgi:hypothetical protein